MNKEPVLYSQIIPLLVAFSTAIIFIIILVGNLKLSNFIFPADPIRLGILVGDLLLGVYLYLKTSIDFAVFTGSVMAANPGWKNRVAVEWGTALGNFVGTLLVIWIWSFFRSTSPLLEGAIVIVASFVLLELAAGSLSRLQTAGWDQDGFFKKAFYKIARAILHLRLVTEPYIGWMPDVEETMSGKQAPNFKALLIYSFSVPFILGSDDFASYISIFNAVNIFSFAVGVILGHTLLLAGIFAAPQKVESLLAKPAFSALAVTTFFIIFAIGFTDGAKLLLEWGKADNLSFGIVMAVAVIFALTHHLRKFAKSGWEKTRERAQELLNQNLPVK